MIHDNLFEYRNSIHRPEDAIVLEQRVTQEINRVFGDDYELYPNLIVKEANRFRQEVDIFVKRKGVPCFVVEVKVSLHSKHGEEVLLRNMTSCQVSYGILTDGKDYRLYAGFGKSYSTMMPLEDIKRTIELNSSHAPQEDEVTILQIRNKMMEAFPSIEDIGSNDAKNNN